MRTRVCGGDFFSFDTARPAIQTSVWIRHLMFGISEKEAHCMTHVTHLNESCHTCINNVNYELCHVWIRCFTYECQIVTFSEEGAYKSQIHT